MSKVIYLNRFPSPQTIATHPVLLFDRYLLKIPQIKKWIEKFPHRYGFEAGENLKQLSSFQKHLNEILPLVEKMRVKDVTFVALGGGSVGDFVGFLASVFKRGVPLVHIPSTWLAAIDSAHGGKTALNAGGYKNQIGTFYSAKEVLLCKPLLISQPEDRLTEAMGEVLKTALLAGGELWSKIKKETHFDQKCMWRYLPELIAYKYKIVRRDPFEKKGLRYVLNFGHTFGHLFEAFFQLPHGVAVNWGLVMALEFSLQRKIIKERDLEDIYQTPLIKKYLVDIENVKKGLKKIKKLESYLLHDKKVSQKGLLHFVFLKKPGKTQVVQTSVIEMIEFAKGFEL